VTVGVVFGALGLGAASYLAADNSDLIAPGEQAVAGAFVGAIGGALAGLLLWAAVVVAEHASWRLPRMRNSR
jgi:hypothetical protein